MKRFIQGIPFKFSRQSLFSILAIVMVVCMVAFLIYSAFFLVRSFDTALDISERGASAERFDIKGFEALQLPKTQ